MRGCSVHTAKRGTIGLGTTTHRRPFQCSTKLARRPFCPTVQTSVDDSAATPLSRVPGGWSPATDQFVPSQCSISARGFRCPTAQTSLADTTATPYRPLLFNPTPGTSVHCPAKMADALRKIAKDNVAEGMRLFIVLEYNRMHMLVDSVRATILSDI